MSEQEIIEKCLQAEETIRKIINHDNVVPHPILLALLETKEEFADSINF